MKIICKQLSLFIIIVITRYYLQNNDKENSPYRFITDCIFMNIFNSWIAETMNVEATDTEGQQHLTRNHNLYI